MIPVLYPLNTTEFKPLGKGKLTEIQSCIVREELNGERELEFTYPITGTHFTELMDGGLVLVQAPHYSETAYWSIDAVVFEIYKFSEPINGIVTFYAQELIRRLLSNQVVIGDGYGKDYTYNVVPDLIYQMNGDSAVSYGIPISAPKSRLACLIGDEESVASTLGADVAIEGKVFSISNGVLMITVSYLFPRGGDYGARIHYGYNLTDVNRTKDTSGTYNAVVPYWENAGTFKYVTGYIVQPTTAITPIRAVTMDLTGVFEEEPTEAEMIEYARNHLDNDTPWIGEDTITADFQNGSSIEDGAQVSLGDIVTVHWEDGQIDTKMRAVAYKYDVIAERYAEITLGTLSKQYVAVTGETGMATASAAAGQTGSSVIYDTQSAVPPIFSSVSYRISGSYTYRAKLLSLYVRFSNAPGSGNVVATLAENLRPASGYVVSPVYSNSSPYAPIGSAWIDSTGKLTVYYSGTPQYAFFCYAVK